MDTLLTLDITQFSLETNMDMERKPLMPKLHTAK